MRYKPEQKAQTRKRIVDAAQRSFKKGGYSGVGVDGLAREAGVTSGAFYGHFGSKKDAFKHAISAGLDELSLAIAELQERYGDSWWQEFADFYTSQKRRCDLTESCALQSLTSEVGRADEDVRELYETELQKITELAGKDGGDRDKVWASLAMLIGGVSLARAVKDDRLADEIADAIKKEVIAMHRAGQLP